MSEGINFAEYTVPRKAEGKNKLARIILVCGYIVFAIAYAGVFISIRIPHLIAVLPIFLWMAVFFSWRYVSYDYEYRVDGGYFTVAKIVGKKKTEKCRVYVREAIEIRPLRENTARKCRAYDYRGDGKSPDSYYAVYENNGARECVCFEATSALVKVLHRLNEKTEVSKELRY